MTAPLIRNLAQQLDDPQAMRLYIAARLHGDAERAPPPIDRYHGIEDYEDVLIALAGDPIFTKQQLIWFWDSVFEVAAEDWKLGDHGSFGRIVVLAWRLGCPPGGIGRLDFLPADSTGFQWGMSERVLVGAHALLWLLVWNARSDQRFWRDNLKTIIREAPAEDAKYLALVRAVDGAGTLDSELWMALLRDALRSERFPTSTLRTALLGHWQHAGGDAEAECRLVQTIEDSLVTVRRTPEPPAAWMSLQALFDEWTEVPWTEIAQQRLRRVVGDNRKTLDGGRPPLTQRHPRRSPKGFHGAHIGWRDAA
jgi:hypothetical protein